MNDNIRFIILYTVFFIVKKMLMEDTLSFGIL